MRDEEEERDVGRRGWAWADVCVISGVKLSHSCWASRSSPCLSPVVLQWPLTFVSHSHHRLARVQSVGRNTCVPSSTTIDPFPTLTQVISKLKRSARQLQQRWCQSDGGSLKPLVHAGVYRGRQSNGDDGANTMARHQQALSWFQCRSS